MIKILLLTQDMTKYKAATYQREFNRALTELADVYCYGPGYPNYIKDWTWETLLRELPWMPDVVILGHSWLSDDPALPLDSHAMLNPVESGLPTAMILNKEYSRLEAKLDYANRARVSLLISHHHEASALASRVQTAGHFMPFAVSSEKASRGFKTKTIDLMFTGVLRNPTFPQSQSDFRRVVQSRIFYTAAGLPVARRKAFRQMNVLWRPIFGSPLDKLASAMGMARLSEDQYDAALESSITCLNGLSPLGLVGTRYFESLAAGSVVIAEPSDVYSHINGLKDRIVEISSDASDLDEKLNLILSDPGEARKFASAGQSYIAAGHTWKHRAMDLIERLKQIV